MMRKRILVIGPEGSGKTSICQYLEGRDKRPVKTAEVVFGRKTIDTSGAYVDNPSLVQHLISLALNHAGSILMVVDASAPDEKYSPGFARIFNCRVWGVATKCNHQNRSRADIRLVRLGVEPPWFYIGEGKNGMEELKKHLTLNGELK